MQSVVQDTKKEKYSIIENLNVQTLDVQKQKSFLDLGLLGLDLKNLILVGTFQVEWKGELGQMKVVWQPD